MLISGQNLFVTFCLMWPWNLTDYLDRLPPLCRLKICAALRSHQRIQARVTVRKHSIWVKISDFCPVRHWKVDGWPGKTSSMPKQWRFFVSCVTLTFDGWSWRIIGHLFYATSSLVHHFVSISEFKLKLRSGNVQFGAKFVVISVTITFDLWPWPFDWISLPSVVITPENLMVIRWEKHCEQMWQVDGWADGRTDRVVPRAAWSQLKIAINGEWQRLPIEFL